MTSAEEVEGQEGRRCTTCGFWKPFSTGFNKDKKGFAGRAARCKECTAKYKQEYYKKNAEKEIYRSRKWYEDNREEALESQKRYRMENREKVADSDRRYRISNRDKLAERAKEYRSLNRGKIYLQQRRWYLANKDIVEKRNHRRRARKAALRDDLTLEQRQDIWARFDNKCALTGSDNVSIDHVLPISIGHGGTYKGNIIPLREDLNYSKGTNNIFEWFDRNKERFDLREDYFEALIEYLAMENGKTVEEYKEYVYWAHRNPIKDEKGETLK